MVMTVRDLLSMAWSDRDCVAIRDCTTCDEDEQRPQYMAVMTARDCWGDWIIDMFSIGDGMYGKNSDKVLHLWVHSEE